MLAPLMVPAWSEQSAASDAGFEGLRHGFFTRGGGCSDGVYEELNCGFGSSDDKTDVAENRRLVAVSLGTVPDQLITPFQVHSSRAVIVSEAWARDDSPKADAIVTKTPGLAIGVLSADCAPILFADPVAGVVGAAHAGWRGALGGIIEATVVKLEEAGASRANIHACVGPCIGGDNYEVGNEFKAQFVEENPNYERFFKMPEGAVKPHFDLPAFVMYRLGKQEIGRIDSQALCTYENESKFFSYRRSTHENEPDYGRQISAIVIC